MAFWSTFGYFALPLPPQGNIYEILCRETFEYGYVTSNGMFKKSTKNQRIVCCLLTLSIIYAKISMPSAFC